MVQEIGGLAGPTVGIVHGFHRQGAGLEYLPDVLFPGERYHGAVVAKLAIMESIRIIVGMRKIAGGRSAGDLFDLNVYVYLTMNDPPAIFTAKKAEVGTLFKVAPYLREREPLIVDLDAFSGQDTGIPEDLLSIHFCAIILHQAIIGRLFYVIAITEGAIVDPIDP